MRECFDDLWIIDLEGDNLGARKTENVFAIQTPVAIAIGVRYAEAQSDAPARVRYAKITGMREEKLAHLERVASFDDLTWRGCYRDWMQPFLPEGTGDYFAYPLLTDLFPWQHSGVQFKRTWPIGETHEVLERRWKALLELTGEERRAAFRETRDRKVDRQYAALDEPIHRLPAINSLSADASPATPTRYAFRSFDRRWVLPDVRLGDFMRPALWKTYSASQLYLATLLTTELGVGPAAVASSSPPDMNSFNNRACHAIPLYRDAEAVQPNITRDLLPTVTHELGVEVSPEDFLAYVYALLASPAYVEKFSEELALSSPRVPITKDSALFRRAIEQGRELIRLHTFGERFTPAGTRRGTVPQGTARCARGVPTAENAYPEQFSYDPATQTLRVGEGEFAPVPTAVWEFSVSGLQVLQSWLAYRMKSGAGRQSSTLDRIRPAQWTAAMTQELLEVIWVLETTVTRFPLLEQLLDDVLQSSVFRADELPQPTAEERQPPTDSNEEEDRQQQLQM